MCIITGDGNTRKSALASSMTLHVLWYRRDLRIVDHPALQAAARQGQVLPVFVLDRHLLFHPETASARVAFLLASLHSLDRDLRQIGGRLLVRQGDADCAGARAWAVDAAARWCQSWPGSRTTSWAPHRRWPPIRIQLSLLDQI